MPDYRDRSDLLTTYPKLSAIYYAKDYGVLVRIGRSWFASNDTRWEKIGIVPNKDLTQPTIGPVSTKDEAIRMYSAAMNKQRSR